MSGHHRTEAPISKLVPSVAMALFALVIVGGYIFKWRWTGFSKDDQLWDLLHVLVLPVVLATLPLWYHTRDRWRVEWRVVLGTVVTAFAVVVIGGYAFDWNWTGFPGNTLWDWLELLALPVVVAFLPLWFTTRRRLEERWRIAFALLFTGFVIVVIGGYQWHWAWTGFKGNTMRDWLQLLVVPFVLPATLAWFAARRESADARVANRDDEIRLDDAPAELTDAADRARS